MHTDVEMRFAHFVRAGNKFQHENHVNRTVLFFFHFSLYLYLFFFCIQMTHRKLNECTLLCVCAIIPQIMYILVFVGSSVGSLSFFCSRRVLECKLVTTFSCVINYASVLLGWMPSTTNTFTNVAIYVRCVDKSVHKYWRTNKKKLQFILWQMVLKSIEPSK